MKGYIHIKVNFSKNIRETIDFIIEPLAAASILASHLSRFSEEIILWVSEGFDFIELPDSLATGSSILPQKKTPDIAELVSAISGFFY